MDKGNVLVIADAAKSRAATAEVLARAGYRVFELPSTIGATRSILRNEISIVVVDVSENGLCCEKLVTALRSTPRSCELVIILVFGKEQAEPSRLEAMSEVDGVLEKRELPSSLLQTLQHALLRRRLGRSLELISPLTA